MADKNDNVSIYTYLAILANAVIIALFVTFVFGLKKDAFDIDTKKLDGISVICQNGILDIVKKYDERIDKILESYPFSDFLQRIILKGVEENEKEKIISIFRSGNYAFDTVSIHLADGKTVFSSPDKSKNVILYGGNEEALAFFDEDYEGVYFIKPILNDGGMKIGYIAASVFKKIFENTSYNLNFVVLPNGVVYYNPSIDINNISREALSQYMYKDLYSEPIDIDDSSYILHSSRIKEIENFSIGILELNVPMIQKYLKYVLLAVLCSSLIFLIASVRYEKKKFAEENRIDLYEDYDENMEDNYNINNINSNNEISEEDNFDLESLDDDFNYLEEYDFSKTEDTEENINEDKLEMKELSELEDLLTENDKFKLDDIEEDLEDVPTLEEALNDEDKLLLNDEDIEELEETPNLDEDEKLKLNGYMEELPIDYLNENEESDNIIADMEDIIDDGEDILISHGSIIEDEIAKKEEEYFSSSDAFNISLNKDFLLDDEDYDGEVIKMADENDTFDKEDLIDGELYNPEEVPKIPDDYYREAEEKIKENMTNSWKKILKSIKGKKFVDKNMNDMLDWIKEISGLDVERCALLEKNEDGVYETKESRNLSDSTKETLKIEKNEGLFKKILSYNKTLYISDPFSSDSLKDKFGYEDRENIYNMIFIPIQNEEGDLKSFFIGLSSN